MLDIDKLKYDYEMPFLNIIKGLKSEIEPSGNISYTINKRDYFYLSKRNNELHYCYWDIGIKLRLEYSFEVNDVKNYVYMMFSKHIRKLNNTRIFCFNLENR